MWIGIVSILPELVQGYLAHGVVGRATRHGPNQSLVVECFNPRDFASDRHKTVDDRPYGGGAGMVLMVEPLTRAIQSAMTAAPAGTPVIYMSPQGRRFDQSRATEMADMPGIILVAGRYEGVDERVLSTLVDAELSVGDYVLSGGELPALVVLDAVARLLPGTLGNITSAVDESFAQSHLDGLLDYPHYTRPVKTGGMEVPAALLSGDHGAVRRHRRRQALQRTWSRRPDLLTQRTFEDEDRLLLREIFIADKDG